MSFDTEGVGLKLACIYLEGRIKILNGSYKEKILADALGSYLYRTDSKIQWFNFRKRFFHHWNIKLIQSKRWITFGILMIHCQEHHLKFLRIYYPILKVRWFGISIYLSKICLNWFLSWIVWFPSYPLWNLSFNTFTQ